MSFYTRVDCRSFAFDFALIDVELVNLELAMIEVNLVNYNFLPTDLYFVSLYCSSEGS